MKLNKNIQALGLSLITLGFVQSAQAQQDPQYTQYMYNHANINPAYAGSVDHLSIFGHYRTQWVGLDGAPKTANISATTPLGDSGLGMGVHFTNDRIGVMDENNIAVDLSYAVDLNNNYKLAFGVKGSANILNVDYTRLHPHNPSELEKLGNNVNEFNPNVGAGMFLYSDKAYVGFSVPNLLTRTRYDDNSYGSEVTTLRQKMHYYLTGGYVFDLSRDVKFKPAALVKATTGAPLQVDLTANFIFMERLTVGAAYRWDASVSGLIGFQVNDNIFLGYSYDAETTALKHYNSGSHEFFVRFDLFSKIKRINAPRYF
ncbi:MAG: type IX secretion system membrane protein PorP/SprF [Flavobacteriaceae bacterium]|jgi:type IX secretion system PorP/SprF family membrane protein|nr:type IX secretion system membrane protein PorP/SprF [Flavobacteriaceae bacterium]